MRFKILTCLLMMLLFLSPVLAIEEGSISQSIGDDPIRVNPPSLNSPSNYAVFNRINTSSITHSWTSVSGALEYWLTVFPSGSSSNPVFHASVGNATSKTVSCSSWSPNVYIWYVKVRTSAGWSTYSVDRQYIVDVPASAPVLSSPAAGYNCLLNDTVTFSWNSVPSAARYALKITTSSGTQVRYIEPAYSPQSVTISTSYFSAGVYNWAVRAIKQTPSGYNSSTYESVMDWGQYSSRSFTVNSLPPTPPNLSSPGDYSVYNKNNTSSITHSWTSVSGALEYWLTVFPSGSSSNPVFHASVGNVTSKTVSCSSWSPNVYIWYVKVRTSAGWSTYSVDRQYIVDVPASAPDLSSPAAGYNCLLNDTVTFSWNSVPSAARYALKITTSSGAQVRYIEPAYSPQSVTISTSYFSAGVYNWAVRAIKQTPSGYNSSTYESVMDWGQYSSRSFTVNSPPANPPVLYLPYDYSVFNRMDTSSIDFSWSSISSATDYWLNIFPSGSSSTPVVNQAVGNVTSKTVTCSNWVPGVYIWQVKVKVSGNWTAYSTHAKEFVIDIPPAPPILNSPSLGTPFDAGDTIEFNWSASISSPINRYFIKIVQGQDIHQTSVYEQPVYGLNHVVQTTGWASGAYTWGIKAIKSAPNANYPQTEYEQIINWGEFSERSFSINSPEMFADFYAIPTSGAAPLSVQFYNQSSGNITSYYWNFGDGTTSNGIDPMHIYEISGDFTVSLTVIGNYGEASVIKHNFIQVTYPEPIADFEYDVNSRIAPLLVNFTNRSSGTITSCLWDFGDGNSSIESNPTHVYQYSGTYSVSLQIVGPGGTNVKTIINCINATHADEQINVPFISQVPPGDWNNTVNCGQTCCVMIKSKYNNTIPVPQDIKNVDDWLHAEYNHPINNYNGSVTSVGILVNILNRMYHLQAVQHSDGICRIDDLINELHAKRPVIVAVTIRMVPGAFGHFMVLKGIDQNYVYVNDPGRSLASGHGLNKKYPRSQFLQSWACNNYAYVTIAGPTFGSVETDVPLSVVSEIVWPNSICIGWNAPLSGTPDYYNVYRNGVLLSQVSDTLNIYIDNNVPIGVPLAYTVSSVSGPIESSQTQPLIVSYPGDADMPQLKVNISMLNNCIQLSWDAVHHATSYIVYETESPSLSNPINITHLGQFEFEDERVYWTKNTPNVEDKRFYYITVDY